MKIRVVKTASNARAVQVVSYQGNKRVILKHIGSAHTDEQLYQLKILARDWIKDNVGQLSIFPSEAPDGLFYLSHSTFVGVKYNFFYQQIRAIQHALKFDALPALLNDLVTVRLFEPASKLRSLELLQQYFGVSCCRKSYYRIVPECVNLKSMVEDRVVQFARDKHGFSFNILLYDVTTLYFESFEEDQLRKNGFSKDNKIHQPQLLIALLVTREGFPLAYEVFSGNTFEGNTILPVIKGFIAKYGVKDFIVVADAAMLSSENIRQLTDNNINYIVGARLGNIPQTLLETIDKIICREDGKSIRVKADNGYLICSYSSLRYRKDKYEMDKQIEKAWESLSKPSKNKRLKFVRTIQQKAELNQDLIEKTKKLLGIKGYYTNLPESVADDKTIMERYHELYKIEHAFRMSKSDLQTRPIFHFKEQPIMLHILICFMALVIGKHIELKINASLKKFINESRKIMDGEILNHITGKKVTIKAQPTQTMKDFIVKLHSPH